MKKSLCALAICLAFGMADAQSSVVPTTANTSIKKSKKTEGKQSGSFGSRKYSSVVKGKGAKKQPKQEKGKGL